ncbi:MAG: hypothetical protein AAB512_02415 [Patescibacteria group bacterium]
MNNKDNPGPIVRSKKETINHWFQWIAFLSLATFLLFSLLFNYGLKPVYWIILAGITISNVPKGRFRDWLVHKRDETLEIVGICFTWGVLIFVIGIALLIGWWFLSSVGNGLGSIGEYDGKTAKGWYNEYDEISSEADELDTQVGNLKTALQEANDNIEQANSDIRKAKYYSGETYEEMVDALDSLDSVDTIDEP